MALAARSPSRAATSTLAENHPEFLDTKIHQRHHVSLWDAMVVRSAARLGCTVLWSEDLADGQDYDGVMVRDPFRNTG